MGTEPPSYSTKELTRDTWPDFETLFTQGNGWDFCWCMAFQRPRPLPSSRYRTRAERSAVNHREKHELLLNGHSHGVLVYGDGQPVGWCQYGTRDELPIMDNPRSRFAKPSRGSQPLEDWRITCFVVAKRYRRRGVATAALRAALGSIRDNGGGIAEAYPIDVTTADGWGPGTWGDYSHFGTVSMFEAEGFVRLAPLGRSNVIMRRTV